MKQASDGKFIQVYIRLPKIINKTYRKWIDTVIEKIKRVQVFAPQGTLLN